jgi:hypothetical protein
MVGMKIKPQVAVGDMSKTYKSTPPMSSDICVILDDHRAHYYTAGHSGFSTQPMQGNMQYVIYNRRLDNEHSQGTPSGVVKP